MYLCAAHAHPSHTATVYRVALMRRAGCWQRDGQHCSSRCSLATCTLDMRYDRSASSAAAGERHCMESLDMICSRRRVMHRHSNACTNRIASSGHANPSAPVEQPLVVERDVNCAGLVVYSLYRSIGHIGSNNARVTGVQVSLEVIHWRCCTVAMIRTQQRIVQQVASQLCKSINPD
jgi:hypothetical protein